MSGPHKHLAGVTAIRSLLLEACRAGAAQGGDFADHPLSSVWPVLLNSLEAAVYDALQGGVIRAEGRDFAAPTEAVAKILVETWDRTLQELVAAAKAAQPPTTS